MKKNLSILLLVLALFASGCTGRAPQGVPASPAADNVDQEDDRTQQPLLPGPGADDYMLSVEEQSNSIKALLEHDASTQADMNMRSQELYELWDGALNYLWNEARTILPDEAFSKLQDEQRIWITEKERAVENAGKDVEGGSLHPLVVNSTAAKLTEERVYELYALLKQSVTDGR